MDDCKAYVAGYREPCRILNVLDRLLRPSTRPTAPPPKVT